MYDRSVIGDLYFDETYDRHEDYIFWLTILKRGIVAKGNHNVLATYVIHSNSKNSNKSKLVKAMYCVYHESQEFNWLKSWIYVFRNDYMSEKINHFLYNYKLRYKYGPSSVVEKKTPASVIHVSINKQPYTTNHIKSNPILYRK